MTRDLVFIANSDEELLGAKGAAVFVQRHADLLKDVEYVITEGTPNRVESERLVHYSVSVAEKLNYSHRLVVKGTPSHASRPNPANPVLSLLTALNAVARFESPINITPTVDKYFRDIAPMYEGERRVWLADIRASLQDERARSWVLSDPAWHAYVRNTAQITVLSASNKTNVIPPRRRPSWIFACYLVNDPRSSWLRSVGLLTTRMPSGHDCFQLNPVSLAPSIRNCSSRGASRPHSRPERHRYDATRCRWHGHAVVPATRHCGVRHRSVPCRAH